MVIYCDIGIGRIAVMEEIEIARQRDELIRGSFALLLACTARMRGLLLLRCLPECRFIGFNCCCICEVWSLDHLSAQCLVILDLPQRIIPIVTFAITDGSCDL